MGDNRLRRLKISGKVMPVSSGVMTRGRTKGAPFRIVRIISGFADDGTKITDKLVKAFGSDRIADMNLPDVIPPNLTASFTVVRNRSGFKISGPTENALTR